MIPPPAAHPPRRSPLHPVLGLVWRRVLRPRLGSAPRSILHPVLGPAPGPVRRLVLRPALGPVRSLARVVAGVLAGVLLVVLAACGAEQAGQPEQSGQSAAGEQGESGPSSGGDRRVAGAEMLKACPSTPSKPPATNSLPDLSLPCLGAGPDIRLADLRGPLVVNVWAQWCPPCRDEAPYLSELQKKAGDKVQLLGIDYADPRPELAVKFATEHGLDFPHLVDAEKSVQQPLKVGGPPVTVFVDKDGAVTYVHRGPLKSQDQLDQLVKDKLGVSW